jgi:hypothetical protein
VARSLGAALLVAGCLVTCAACGREDRPLPDRRAELRRLIEENLHFNLHGFHRVVDERTGPGVRPHVTEDDIPILATFLGNSEVPAVIQYGAAAVMVEFGEAARSAFTRAKERGWVDAWLYLERLDRRREAAR